MNGLTREKYAMKKNQLLGFNPSDIVCSKTFLPISNGCQRKYKPTPLLPHNTILKITHFAFVLLKRTPTGRFGFAKRRETMMARWNPSNAPHAWRNQNNPMITARYTGIGAIHFMILL